MPVCTRAGLARVLMRGNHMAGGGGQVDNNQDLVQANQPGQGAEEISLATFNCAGYKTETLATILEVFSQHPHLILALQDLGGNRNEPAAARLAADSDILQSAGIMSWHNADADCCVALLYSKSIAQCVFEKSSANTHITSLQLCLQNQYTQVTSTYWRPAGSARASCVDTGSLENALSGPGRHVLCGDLNCCVKKSNERVVADRADTRSRAVARWMQQQNLAPLTSSHTYRRSQRENAATSTIDYIAMNSDSTVATSTRWVSGSDHCVLSCTLHKQNIPCAQAHAHAAQEAFILPAYGAYEWHTFGEKLQQKMQGLINSMESRGTSDVAMQQLADELHASITDTARTTFRRYKINPRKGPKLPKAIQLAKKDLRRHQRNTMWKQHDPAQFYEKEQQLREALHITIRQHKQRTSFKFAQKNSPLLQTLASREAWKQVKGVMARGQRKHSVLQQETLLDREGNASRETQSIVRGHLHGLLNKPPLPPASDEAMDTLQRVATADVAEPTYGDNAQSDKAKPAGETEFPRTPWRPYRWGEEVAADAEEEGPRDGFSARFIKDAVKQLATNSSGGMDGITAEMLRWVDSHQVATLRKQLPEGTQQHQFNNDDPEWHWPVIMQAIADCFNLFAAEGFVPAQWKTSKTILIHKKGPHDDLGNYRPIAAGNTVGKLFAHCLLYGIEGWATQNGVLSTLQRGFRSHRGCEECILALQCILRSHQSVGENTHNLRTSHVCFVDFQQAYDSVDHGRLLSKLQAIGLTGPVLDIIRASLEGVTTIGRSSQGDTAPIAVTKGLPQGHVLSPMLFSLYINDLLLRLQELNAHRRGGDKLAEVGALAYADDIVLVDRTLTGLQTKLDIVRKWSDEWGMTVNLKRGKTEHMVFGSRRRETFALKFGPHVVNRTSHYKYLGVHMDSDDTQFRMKRQRKKTLGAAYAAHNAVAQLQIASPDIPIGVIGSIWQTWVIPQLCYAVGVWGHHEDSLVVDKFTHRCGTQLLGTDRCTARAIVMAEMGWRSTKYWVSYHQYRTLSRLFRAPQDDLLHKILVDQLQALRRRPDNNWMGPVLENLGNSSFSEGRKLRKWIQEVLPTINPSKPEEFVKQLDALDFENTWAGTALHEEFTGWKGECSAGNSRLAYLEGASERRDRKGDLDVKPRWATIMRPSRSLKHLIGRADSKLLCEARIGSKRSLSSRSNQARSTIGTLCPMCGSAEDNVQHMLQCTVVLQDPGIQEAMENLIDSMQGRQMNGRGKASDVLDLEVLAKWVTSPAEGTPAVKVLLGNCDLRCVPVDMRRMYMQMQIQPRLHNLWLQGCVSILRAAWSIHDAEVRARLADAEQAAMPHEGEPTDSEDEALNAQDSARQIVEAFGSAHRHQAPHQHGRGESSSHAADAPGVYVARNLAGDLAQPADNEEDNITQSQPTESVPSAASTIGREGRARAPRGHPRPSRPSPGTAPLNQQSEERRCLMHSLMTPAAQAAVCTRRAVPWPAPNCWVGPPPNHQCDIRNTVDLFYHVQALGRPDAAHNCGTTLLDTVAMAQAALDHAEDDHPQLPERVRQCFGAFITLNHGFDANIPDDLD